ncbi:translation initiation factor IF-2 N-terminal domain-containing protein [Gordonia sp. HY002]|uniref:translation initiation factor IF-2 N-terminal domain-containing protein n=1 Tax=Gordonia zhenghanii TaxID=2911516 RepID=UPI001EF09AF2|nr:translation initiation factor IF-2 N-terminal domain-containing protein [Gordonia zhenghanii]MCF8569496.1 translation initiation factor IF-2 N-terminal domain-containing protein [Gordonia zhenghanii]MCF8602333.1 translation initiation factor IF-2 N-terminal domain-containing protein [Gordonia zhenghanii]
MTDNGSPVNADSAHLSAEDIPLRLRVHALARLLGSTSRDVLGHLGELGVTARTAQSSISRDDAMRVAARFGALAPDVPAAEAPSESTPDGPSLFSAVEVVEPSASTSAADVAAPLFLAAEPEESGAKGAKKKAEAAKPDETAKPNETTKPDETAKPEGDEPEAKKSADSESADSTPERKKSPRRNAPKTGETGSAASAGDSAPANNENANGETAAGDSADGENSDGENSDGENSDGENSDGENSDGSNAESRSRRRRRGRRGRGRGRGDQAEDGDHRDADDRGSDDGQSDASESSADGDSSADKNGRRNGGGRNGNGTKSGDENRSANDANDADAKDSADKNSAAKSGADKNAADKNSDDNDTDEESSNGDSDDDSSPTSKRRRRRRRRRGTGEGDDSTPTDDPPNTVVHEREPRTKRVRDEVQGISGSTRLEAKRQRRRDGRDAGRRRPPILTESEFLARRESVERVMVVRERNANSAVNSHDSHSAPTEDYTQVAVLEDGVLVEHFVTTETSQSMVGNIYLGRVQNVLPGMEAAFVDIGRGRNGVLYAGEVNWEAAGLDGRSRKIEQALKPGDNVLVQVSKDPVGHKGARLTTQISLAGRYLVYVPGGSSTGISRKLPDTERKRLKQILSKVVPDGAGVIIRTASEGVSEPELAADVERLESQWKTIEAAATEHKAKGSGTTRALYEEPDLLVRVVRDLFNEDFAKLVVEGDKSWKLVSGYVRDVAPDLFDRVEEFTKAHADAPDSFAVHRIDEQLAKALDRKVWLPSGGTLIIEHTEAMTVVDVNTGKFTGSGGNLEETVTRNNLEAAEEIVRQMRLRDIGGMIVVDFIDMVLESNRDLVLRRLTEALGRDRTRHQVSEVTSLGLVQMTRKRLGTGLLEAFSTTCTACSGRGVIVHANPVEVRSSDDGSRSDSSGRRSRRKKGGNGNTESSARQASEQPKEAPHKPAAEHPLFRAMAHHDDAEAADSGANDSGAETTGAKDSGAKDSGVGNSGSRNSRTKNSRDRNSRDGNSRDGDSAATTDAASTSDAEKSPVVEAAPAPTTPAPATPESEPVAPVTTVTRRRRAVRRTSAPTAIAPEPITVTSDEPVTTVAAQTAEPVVAVTRTPRRRTGRRAAGPPPSEQ